MDDIWFQILVIILSVFLAIFLVLGIIVLVKVIQLMKIIREISENAQSITEKLEAAASSFQKTAGRFAFANILSNVSDLFSKKGRGK